MFFCENTVMLPGFNYTLQCMKNNPLGVFYLHPLALCCLQRRDAWPWQEMTIFESAVTKRPTAPVKKPSREVMWFSTPLLA